MSDDVLRTPDEWLALKHPRLQVRDPDGWRGQNGRPWTDAISESEFNRRLLDLAFEALKVAFAEDGYE